ncbi:uncharacterized protein LOC121260223 [Juglans microcarpa x Juglans regia]|uniref:uncharacterized protein LOC121260223 n=1 Tax=Juglans microcarpa x Juglans regia TaxID=2249226 RepID=UPI001B7F4710|nr:uncharacterized protein LOC121260223 [Juglans microcarpa x Juglans regia]
MKDIADLQAIGTGDNYRLIQDLQKTANLYLEKEELKWKQRVKQNWLHKGDRNTQYYHNTVASESTFSTGGRVLDSFRSSLAPATVEALICTQNWIKGTPIHVSDVLKYEEADVKEEGDDQPGFVIHETASTATSDAVWLCVGPTIDMSHSNQHNSPFSELTDTAPPQNQIDQIEKL